MSSIESSDDMKLREDAKLVNNLAYIDDEIDAATKEKINELIIKEMSDMPKNNYKTKSFYFDENVFLNKNKKTLFLNSEMKRIEKRQKLNGINDKIYQNKPPTGNSLKQWKNSLNNLGARIEEIEKQFEHLELLKKFGPNLWKNHAEKMEMELDSLKSHEKNVDFEISKINRKRKTEQESAQTALSSLSERWWKLVRKNNEIETACKVLEMRIKRRK
ncbi:hypothetical protein MHBO_000871 [Bonamia ostreae]|uniref:Pre-mRNA-splicing factor SPF27 n=1 Tax=Bonamia ostreae TaxID=126728 RepID=A0ABV2AH45_9EUKA